MDTLEMICMDEFETGYLLMLQLLPKQMGEKLGDRGTGHPFPRGLKTRQEVEAVGGAMRESFGPLDPNDGGLLTRSQRCSVACGADHLGLACLLYSAEYGAPYEGRFESLPALLSLEYSTSRRPGGMTSLGSKFEEVATGEECRRVETTVGTACQWVPSKLVRNSDGLRPYDQVKPNGSRGMAPEEEPMLREWSRYKQEKFCFERSYPELNYPLLVKRALLPLCPEGTRDKVFTPGERASNELFEKRAGLRRRYESALRDDSRECDLLDRLEAEAMFKFLGNEKAGDDARQTYLGRLQSHIERMECR